jgi:hypothetical protein
MLRHFTNKVNVSKISTSMKILVLLPVFSFLSISGYTVSPQLSFFCELDGKRFSELFSDSALIMELVEMKVSLRIGLHDFSAERTVTMQKLNRAGIPLIAWLLLPEEEGYWFNTYNGEKASERYKEFKKWTADNQLKWEGIGIDLEPDMNNIKLAIQHPWEMVWKVYKRLYDDKSLESGKKLYQDLIAQMKSDGYQVESYIIPIIYEERAKKTRSLQKLAGIADIETDKEIPMSYTSVMNNPGIIPIYHRDNMPIALGSTGGGVVIEGIEAPAISRENLERDLLIASGLTDEIIIFCLETSVQREFLTKIKNLDYNRIPPDISSEIQKQNRMNGWIRFFLVILDHPFWLTLALLVIISGILFGIIKLVVFIIKKSTPHSQS